MDIFEVGCRECSVENSSRGVVLPVRDHFCFPGGVGGFGFFEDVDNVFALFGNVSRKVHKP